MLGLSDLAITKVPVVVLDTETTGLIPSVGHRVVEIAAVRIEASPSTGWQVTNQISQLLNPGRSMDPDASRINGIYDDDLRGKPSFEDIASELFSLASGALLVAHNAQFDASFLGMELFIMGNRTQVGKPMALPNPWLCTLMLARRNFHFGRYSLTHIARMLGVRAGRAHRALGDVFTTAEVFKRMIREMAEQDITQVGDLLLAQGGPIYTPVIPEIDLPPPLNVALAGKKGLRILYRGPAGEKVHNVTAQYATEYAGNKYLVASYRSGQDQRTFRVDRITAVEIVGGNSTLSSGDHVDNGET
jgi:DNA polymerase-3 subunit epsilon